jgi:adenylate cyclase
MAMSEIPSRRLAAILAADIAGYSALVGVDEARTVRDLKEHQAAVLPMVVDHGGRVIDTAGDGFLADFGSAVNAVECAIAVQERMVERNRAVDAERRMQFRMGINIGDIICDQARIYGDGINIAARLQSIAEPGGIVVSRQAQEQVEGRVAIDFRAMGLQTLKNIARPIETTRSSRRVTPARLARHAHLLQSSRSTTAARRAGFVSPGPRSARVHPSCAQPTG